MAITISGSGITSANIADGTIVNADISSIAASKLTGMKTVGGVSLVGAGDIPAGVAFLNSATADGQELRGLSDGSYYIVGGTNGADYPSDFNTTVTTSGSFTVPSNVTEIWIRASASGGNAGGLPYAQFSGPGGNGGRVSKVWAVAPGDILSWTSPNTSGTMTVSLNGSNIITCTGGGQGGNSINGYMGPAGADGASSFSGTTVSKNTFQITGFDSMPEGGAGGSPSKTVAYNPGSSGSFSYAYKLT